ncbi:hydroxyacid-oxoacid transhydrogenase [Spongisporangium articulatum]|uniref:hydroxyacid-oxoacid transhydrogenase n=1 Tax=Spongisporangium articulatum TaxID=3362603 RepID=A0ABW8AHY6_9ACTN
MSTETVFTYGAPQLKFGAGAADEIGYDVGQFGATRVLVITDAGVLATGAPARVADSLRTYGMQVQVFSRVHVEPTDESIAEAVEHARDTGPWDAFVAVGGGSCIDTAKAVNLLTTCGGELLDYVNPPVGAGQAPDRPLKPLIAVPTTAGTGAESTTVCVLDVLALKVKTGISHARLRPVLAVVDPTLTHSLPAEVTAACGMDILCHALESYTARPFDARPRKKPAQRVPYCGSNPVADMWSERALGLLSSAFRRAVHHGHEDTPDARAARHDMMLAATFAGLGFGNAGVHVPHANAYPIAGRVADLPEAFHPAGYPAGHPMVPHGMSVCLTAPEAFRFTFDTDPDRHVRAATLLAPTLEAPDDPAEHLPLAVTHLMRDIGMPNGIGGVGFGEEDVDALVEGALKQQRLLDAAPRDVHAEDLAGIFRRSVENW